MEMDDFLLGVESFSRRLRVEMNKTPVSAEKNGLLTLRRPDDFHLHLRDGEILKAVLPFTTKQFARAVVMPNKCKQWLQWKPIAKSSLPRCRKAILRL
jgi:hypothetical protein